MKNFLTTILFFLTVGITGSFAQYQEIAHIGGASPEGMPHAYKFSSASAGDANGKLFIAGHFQTEIPIGNQTFINSQGVNSGYLAKLNPATGIWDWAVQIPGLTMTIQIGNSTYTVKGSVYIHNAATDAGGNVYLTGRYFYRVQFGTTILTVTNSKGNYPSDAFLAKYNSAGVFQWVKNIGSSKGDDQGLGLAVNGTFIYMVGKTTNRACQSCFTPYIFDIYSAKFNNSGILQWEKKYAGESNTDDAGTDIAIDNLGNPYVSGKFSGRVTFATNMVLQNSNPSAFVLKLNSSGVSQWVREVGPARSSYGFVLIDGNNNPLIAADTVLAKYTPAGQVVWKKPTTLLGDFNGGHGIHDMFFYASGNIGLVNDELNPLAPSGRVLQIQQYSASGDFISEVLTTGIDSTAHSAGCINGIIPTATGYFLVMGNYTWGTIVLDNLTLVGDNDLFSTGLDIFIVEYTGSGPLFSPPGNIQMRASGHTETSTGLNFTAYPNPVENVLYIESTQTDLVVYLVDVSGKVISKNIIPEGRSEVDLSELTSGVYFLQAGDGSGSLKVIKR